MYFLPSLTHPFGTKYAFVNTKNEGVTEHNYIYTTRTRAFTTQKVVSVEAHTEAGMVQECSRVGLLLKWTKLVSNIKVRA